MFGGIGLMLASDYLDAFSKIFSMFKTLGKVKNALGCSMGVTYVFKEHIREKFQKPAEYTCRLG